MCQELQRRIMGRLKKQTLSARILLHRFYFPNDDLRKKPEYQDNRWMPFWYYLGAEERPQKVMDMGSQFGLETACCVLGCPALVSVYKARSRFTIKNIKLASSDAQMDCGQDWDLAVVHSDFSDQLDSIWEKTKLGGLICTTANKEIFEDFAKIKNREPVFCNLRYNVGLLRK